MILRLDDEYKGRCSNGQMGAAFGSQFFCWFLQVEDMSVEFVIVGELVNG